MKSTEVQNPRHCTASSIQWLYHTVFISSHHCGVICHSIIIIIIFVIMQNQETPLMDALGHVTVIQIQFLALTCLPILMSSIWSNMNWIICYFTP